MKVWCDIMMTLLTGAKVFEEVEVFSPGYVLMNNKRIVSVGPMTECPNLPDSNHIKLKSTDMIIPGMIDIHIHGVGGFDVMDSTTEALRGIAKLLPEEGTTSYLATTITQSVERISDALSNVSNYKENYNSIGCTAELLGVHLEGPFISVKRAGAQPEKFIIPTNVETFDTWQQTARGNIKVVTLAPEEDHGYNLIKRLINTGVIASAGHTDSTYHQMNEAVRVGLQHTTHLYNQMSSLHHREPGVVGSALLHKNLMSEIIGDGVHVSPEIIQLTYNILGPNNLILITDSIRAKGLKDGNYDLGGQRVTVTKDKATLDDGTLAGSTLKMIDAFKNILRFTSCSIKEAIQMTSQNAARQLNIYDRKGSITKGKDADLVILSEELNIKMTFCRGEIAYEEEVKS